MGVSLTGGCTAIPGPDTQEGVPPITTATIQENASVQYYPSDEPLRLALEHFNRGNFGIAEQYSRCRREGAQGRVGMDRLGSKLRSLGAL